MTQSRTPAQRDSMMKLARTIVWAGETFTADTPIVPMTEPASGGYFTARIEQDNRLWYVSLRGDDVVTTSDDITEDPRLTYTVAVNGRKVEARYVDDADARVSVRLQYRDSGHHVTVWRSGELILELGL